MNNSPMTFCISVFNGNLNYLRKAVDSIVKYAYYKDPLNLVIYNEYIGEDIKSLKEYEKWYNELLELNTNIVSTYCRNEMDGESLDKKNKWYYTGIGGGMNLCAEKVKTEYIMFVHADMVVSKNFDLKAWEVAQKYKDVPTWISSQRFQPNLFLEESRPGTLVFPYEEFGYTHENFNEDYFIQYAEEFSKMNPDIEYTKGEGVSGLIKKEHWDTIGGNDPIYAPGYWEDKDLWMRMQLAEYKFVLTTNSVLFHFGSRSANSNFPSDSQIIPGQKAIRSEKSKENERRAAESFRWKWGFWPEQNEHGFDIFPRHLNKNDYKDRIKLDLDKSYKYIKLREKL